jgi:hypothetical protein
MSRKMTGILCVSFTVAALGLLNAKYQVKGQKMELDLAIKHLTRERAQIHILEAEWAYLNRPENLSTLVRQHLPNFSPVRPSQVLVFHSLGSVRNSGAPPP